MVDVGAGDAEAAAGGGPADDAGAGGGDGEEGGCVLAVSEVEDAVGGYGVAEALEGEGVIRRWIGGLEEKENIGRRGKGKTGYLQRFGWARRSRTCLRLRRLRRRDLRGSRRP